MKKRRLYSVLEHGIRKGGSEDNGAHGAKPGILHNTWRRLECHATRILVVFDDCWDELSRQKFRASKTGEQIP